MTNDHYIKVSVSLLFSINAENFPALITSQNRTKWQNFRFFFFFLFWFGESLHGWAKNFFLAPPPQYEIKRSTSAMAAEPAKYEANKFFLSFLQGGNCLLPSPSMSFDENIFTNRHKSLLFICMSITISAFFVIHPQSR